MTFNLKKGMDNNGSIKCTLYIDFMIGIFLS